MQLKKGGEKSIFKKLWFWIVMLVVVVGIVMVMGNSEDSTDDLQGGKFDLNIDLVKNGAPEMISDITYQQAYEYFFDSPQWRGFTADTGEEVVEFTGKCIYYDQDAQVYIQFVIEDEETFSMYYAHMKVDGETVSMGEREFLELAYTPFETYSQEVLGKELDDNVQALFEQLYESLN